MHQHEPNVVEKVLNAKVTLRVQVKVTLRVQVKVTLRVQILCLACSIFFTTRLSLVDFRFQTVLCRSNLLCYLIKVILVDFTLVYFIPSAMACYIKVGFYCVAGRLILL